jgi:hypothetical protein
LFHRRFLSTLPVRQDQEFQPREKCHETSAHRQADLLSTPGPCRAQPASTDCIRG